MTHRSTIWRHQKFGAPAAPQSCGTYAAARRHQRHGEPLCDACRRALADHQARMYRQRKKDTPA